MYKDNTRAELLFSSLNLLFSDVALAVVRCLSKAVIFRLLYLYFVFLLFPYVYLCFYLFE